MSSSTCLADESKVLRLASSIMSRGSVSASPGSRMYMSDKFRVLHHNNPSELLHFPCGKTSH